MRQKIVELARSYIGANEADESHRKIIDLYNSISPLPRGYRMTYSDPWCAAFPSALAQELGITDTVLPECSCDAMIELYKAKGWWVEADNYVPLPGDFVMYDWQDSGTGDNQGSADHVGIVEEVTGSSQAIIEGNMADKVGRRRIAINGKFIRGYCVPPYKETKNDGTIIVVTPNQSTSPQRRGSKDKFTLTMRYLRYGDTGDDVQALQRALWDKGLNINTDGKFEDTTRNCLTAFQKNAGIEPDGEFGPITFNALWF